MIPTPAGRAADCGRPAATARPGSRKAGKAPSRWPCMSSCGTIHWRNDQAADPTGPRSLKLVVKVEQALDGSVDAGQIGELKLGAEQQLQSDAVDRLHPDLGAEAFEKGIALDPSRYAAFDQSIAQGFDRRSIASRSAVGGSTNVS